MTSVYRLIEDCAAASGSDGFAARIVDLAGWTGVRQLMVFEMTGDAVTCLLSRNYERVRTGEVLAGRYMDGWFRMDPLLPELMRLPAGQTHVRRMDDIVAKMPPDYFDIFFSEPGLSGKTTVLAVGLSRRMMVNFYHGEAGAPKPDEALLSLIARLVLNHHESHLPAGYPACLAALSERERQICLGVLGGKKAEMIAGELGLSPATIVTYRRRAYGKLGISSRGDPFALCRKG